MIRNWNESDNEAIKIQKRRASQLKMSKRWDLADSFFILTAKDWCLGTTLLKKLGILYVSIFSEGRFTTKYISELNRES